MKVAFMLINDTCALAGTNSRRLLRFCVFAVCIPLLSCTNKGQYFEESGSVFHTLYKIQYQSPQLLTDKIDKELQDFNLSLNPFNPNSIIAKVNKNETVEVDDWFTDVFNKAQEISEKTNGVFDATGAPLFNLWGFGFSKMDSITPQMIDSIKAFVGYNKIRLEGRQVVKDDPRVMLNYSAIAKGYACDVIARLLEREGVTNYMIDIGGEITIKGVNQNGNCWRVGINKPEDDLGGINKKVEEVMQPCKKCGVATSGDYRNYYEKDGKKYAHTIDPRTGYPAGQNILSSTVIAKDCMTADGYATAFMALGSEKAIEIAQSIPEIEYYLIYVDNKGKHQIAYSKGMLEYLPNRKTLDILENP
ncbi:MAG: FAD:protein FMN transferase [Tannerellaceae bacterium]|jgi:thiamine biosynthesis lipoprotein|nr:FAD:protein FMN transferase [Tannerellaceae bacterium]